MQTAGLYLLAAVSAGLLLRMLVVPGRNGSLFVAGLLLLTGSLTALSTPRQVGDSAEHVRMAQAIARGSLPVPSDGSEFRRFWSYALAAAPFVRAAESAGFDSRRGFAALNILLLASAGAILVLRVSATAALLLTAGPILWWVDKAHPDVFTFSLITIAVTLLDSAPWWSVVALGAAATQSPPLTFAMLIAGVFGALKHGVDDRRMWMAAALGLLLASLNPLYLYARLGTGAMQAFEIDAHVPLTRELLSPAFDPNIGIFVHAPFVAAALATALILALVRAPAQLFTLTHAAAMMTGLVFLLAFTQTTNVNGGGTPGPSRFGLWLLPIGIPLLQAAPPAAAVRIAAAASLVWCALLFAPARPENHLRPTRLAAMLWQRWPAADNPLVEIFSERVSGAEPAPAPPLATPDCEKVLIVGRGSGSPTAWPARCQPALAPPFCREPGVLCYANRSDAAYGFTILPETWAAENPIAPDQGAELIAVEPPADAGRFAGAGMTAGWSYLERLPGENLRWRWMSDQAELAIAAHQPLAVRLRVETRAHARPRRLILSMPAGGIATWTIPVDRAVFETGPIDLAAGWNVIRFESADGADVPAGEDRRRLSVAVFGITVIVPD